MSVIVLKRKFDTIPAAKDIMQVLLESTVVDEDKAAQALQAFLAPMKDLMRLFYLVGEMKTTAERHTELLKEQSGLVAEVGATKKAVVDAKSAYDKSTTTQNSKLDDLADKIVKLEKAKTVLEDEQATRDRLNTVMVAEIAAAKKELMAEVDKEVSAVKTELLAEATKAATAKKAFLTGIEKDISTAVDKLAVLKTAISTAEKELADLDEKKRKFIASLSGL
jgi:hypothetical protein